MNWAMLVLLALSPFDVSDDMATRIHVINFFLLYLLITRIDYNKKTIIKIQKYLMTPYLFIFILRVRE